MICPDCGGEGRIRKRFLIFFTRRARCPKCLGTGEFPPPERVRDVVRYRTRYRDVDDRDRWSTPAYIPTPAERPARDDERFEVGSGGRSGGGGAAASWGDASSDTAPVIADPFAGDSSGATSAVVADASAAGSWSDSSASRDSDTSSSDSSSSGDSGTSY